MPRLAVARDPQIDAIYEESHALWGGGLSLEDYRGLWTDLGQSAWGRQHATFCVWLDEEGRVLSSMKLYRPMLRINGRVSRSTVIGAVFTPSAQRRSGHAAAMVREAVRQARRRGESTVMLFSDIGTRYYAASGFTALPAEEQWGSLPRSHRSLPRGWKLREMLPIDRAEIERAHHAFCLGRPIAFVRDSPHWEFLWLRAESYFGRLGHPEVKQTCQIAEHNGRFAGYVVSVAGRRDWHVREIGALDGDPGRMEIILRLGAHRARRAGLRGLYAWLPPEVLDRLPDWPVLSRSRKRAQPMVLSLDEGADLSLLQDSRAAYLPFQDQF